MRGVYKDKIFGILNRNGFEFKINKLGGDFTIYLLDFKKVGKMNSRFGYLKTNRIFKKVFKKLKKEGFIIGRCFYGDEILISIPFSGYVNPHILDILTRYCSGSNLKFRHVSVFHYGGTKISKTIKKLVKKIEKYK